MCERPWDSTRLQVGLGLGLPAVLVGRGHPQHPGGSEHCGHSGRAWGKCEAQDLALSCGRFGEGGAGRVATLHTPFQGQEGAVGLVAETPGSYFLQRRRSR